MTTESWRSRPVFISSTFRDMQAERDHLREHVFPRLEDELRKNRHHLEPIDLRQGVETADADGEAARELLVLKVCLDEIKRSRPYLIVLLGDRYGWVPPDDRMAVAAQEAGFQADLTGKSVTALEIEFGIIKEDPDQRRRSFFFFREPLPSDDPDYNDACSPDPQVRARHDKLLALKQRLTDDPELGPRVHTYRAGWDAQKKCVTGLEAWGNQVFDLLWKDLEQETRAFAAQPPPTWEEAERQALAEFVEHRTRGFVGREEITRQLLELARSPQADGAPWGACVTGQPGSGKSALFAHLFRELSATPSSQNSNTPILLLSAAAGISTRSASVDAMLRRWIQKLADFLKITNPLPEKASAEDVENTFAALLGRAAQQRRVVVLMDALNQFEPTVRARHMTWLKPKAWPSNARLIATSLPCQSAEALLAKDPFGVPPSGGPGFGVPALAGPAGSNPTAADSDRLKAGLQTLASPRGVVEFVLPPLTEADAEQIAKKVWQRYHRQFNREVFRVLVGKGAVAIGNPLWLNLALEQLNLLDADDFARADREFTGGPVERLRALVLDVARRLPAEVEGLFDWMLEHTEKVHGVAETRAMATAIALSRSGWRETDLLALVPRLAPLLAPLSHPMGEGQGEGVRGEGSTFDALRLAALRRAFRGQAVKRGALEQLDFFHAQMRAAVLRRCVAGEDLRRKLHAALADHLLGLPENDALRAGETMHHLIGADDQARAASYYAQLSNHSDAFATTTRTLTEHVLSGNTNVPNPHLSWLLGLLTVPHQTTSTTGTLCFQFLVLGDALEHYAPLDLRRALLDGVHVTLKEIVRSNPTHIQWKAGLASTLASLAHIAREQGDLPTALNHITASQAIVNSVSYNAFEAADEQLPDLGCMQMTHARLLLDLGKDKEAFGIASEVLKTSEAAYAARPQDATVCEYLGFSLCVFGDAAFNIGDANKALAAFQRSLDIRLALSRSFPAISDLQRDVAQSYSKVGKTLLWLNRHLEAKEAAEAQFQVLSKLVSVSPDDNALQKDLALCHGKLRNVEDSLRNYQRALYHSQEEQRILSRLIEQDPSDMDSLFELSCAQYGCGDAHEELGNLAEAFKECHASIRTLETLHKCDPTNAKWSSVLYHSWSLVGWMYHKHDNCSMALRCYTKGILIAARNRGYCGRFRTSVSILSNTGILLLTIGAWFGWALTRPMRHVVSLNRRSMGSVGASKSQWGEIAEEVCDTNSFLLFFVAVESVSEVVGFFKGMLFSELARCAIENTLLILCSIIALRSISHARLRLPAIVFSITIAIYAIVCCGYVVWKTHVSTQVCWWLAMVCFQAYLYGWNALLLMRLRSKAGD